jgi:thymidine phosphorylase
METVEFESMLNAIINGENQSKDIIFDFVEDITTDSIDEGQIIKWLKTMHKFGCTNEDVVNLTTAMRTSGATLEWSDGKPVVDKHSTGGVGDKMWSSRPYARWTEPRSYWRDHRQIGIHTTFFL